MRQCDSCAEAITVQVKDAPEIETGSDPCRASARQEMKLWICMQPKEQQMAMVSPIPANAGTQPHYQQLTAAYACKGNLSLMCLAMPPLSTDHVTVDTVQSMSSRL